MVGRRKGHPNRRDFLKLSAGVGAGLMLSNCRRQLTDVQAGNGGSQGAAQGSDTLEIYTWAAYVDDEVVESFQNETGIKVNLTLYDSNETMLAKLQAGGGGNFSIVYPSDYMVAEMIDLGLLEPLDPSRMEGMDTLLANWANPAYDPGNGHSIPYAWGTTGLVFNGATLSPAPEDWDYLWENQASLTRQVTLLNDVREVMGAALKSLGYSNNSTNPQEIEAAFNRLMEIRPTLASFTTDAWQDQLLAGDLTIAMGYSSDAISVQKENPDIRYIVPASGAALWTDTIAILKSAPNKDAAYAWLNYQMRPENAATNVRKLNFATPVKPAIELLPTELKNNTNLFPPDEVLSRCEALAPVGDAIDLYDQYWTQLTSA